MNCVCNMRKLDMQTNLLVQQIFMANTLSNVAKIKDLITLWEKEASASWKLLKCQIKSSGKEDAYPLPGKKPCDMVAYRYYN